jgi:hypothetical protein
MQEYSKGIKISATGLVPAVDPYPWPVIHRQALTRCRVCIALPRVALRWA